MTSNPFHIFTIDILHFNQKFCIFILFSRKKTDFEIFKISTLTSPTVRKPWCNMINYITHNLNLRSNMYFDLQNECVLIGISRELRLQCISVPIIGFLTSAVLIILGHETLSSVGSLTHWLKM